MEADKQVQGRALRTGVLVLIFAATIVSAHGQTEKQIAAIRADVNSINKSAPKYDNTTKNLDGISLEGTEATYFISGRGLKKISAKIYGETYRSTVELYYSGEELIFAFQRLERYNTHIAATPPPRVAKVEETRLYRSGAKTIRILAAKKQLKPDDIKFTEAEYQLIELADQLKSAYVP